MASWRETSPDDPAARELLREYFAFRAAGFPREMGEYRVAPPDPAQFVPPRGVFLIVEGEDEAGEPADVGCGGIRRIEAPDPGDVRYEVKHVWLEPHVRGRGLGRALLEELERRARAFGATELVLDTNDSLQAAARLYRSSGFRTIPPFNDNPNATTWYGKRLRA